MPLKIQWTSPSTELSSPNLALHPIPEEKMGSKDIIVLCVRNLPKLLGLGPNM